MTSSASAASRRRCATPSRRKRIAQSFVFAGPRGVGKTTTARILARALNCVTGPTADPCGDCDACVEIAQGRDMDVLEIDAATYTQVDKVREVIITGLGIAPVRDRYKIFIIDEVHRLSQQAFDALLKSIEEPPPHVVFMMATTEIDKVPPTIQSRSQVFELKTIGVKPIADQLRTIADAEQIADRRRGADAGGARRRRQHARRAERVRPGHRVRRRRRITADDVGDGARASSAATCCSTSPRPSRARTPPRVFELAGARGRVRLRPAPRRPRAGAADARPAGRRHRPVARSTIRRSPPRASASGSRRWRRSSRART